METIMRLVVMSDTHSMHTRLKVPDGDILIHAGDLSWNGRSEEITNFRDWFLSMPHKHKVLIAGNHDWLFERQPLEAKALFSYPNVHYLEQTSAEIEGLKFWGSPATPWFCSWAFNYQRGAEIRLIWNRIPECDILVTHGPPIGILDQARPGHSDHLGCKDLLDAIKRIQPRLHVFGHIHGPGGGKLVSGMTTHINASVVNEAYKVVRDPITFDWPTR
jgi:Icc-related predicted phosphoesterase